MGFSWDMLNTAPGQLGLGTLLSWFTNMITPKTPSPPNLTGMAGVPEGNFLALPPQWDVEPTRIGSVERFDSMGRPFQAWQTTGGVPHEITPFEQMNQVGMEAVEGTYAAEQDRYARQMEEADRQRTRLDQLSMDMDRFFQDFQQGTEEGQAAWGARRADTDAGEAAGLLSLQQGINDINRAFDTGQAMLQDMPDQVRRQVYADQNRLSNYMDIRTSMHLGAFTQQYEGIRSRLRTEQMADQAADRSRVAELMQSSSNSVMDEVTNLKLTMQNDPLFREMSADQQHTILGSVSLAAGSKMTSELAKVSAEENARLAESERLATADRAHLDQQFTQSLGSLRAALGAETFAQMGAMGRSGMEAIASSIQTAGVAGAELERQRGVLSGEMLSRIAEYTRAYDAMQNDLTEREQSWVANRAITRANVISALNSLFLQGNMDAFNMVGSMIQPVMAVGAAAHLGQMFSLVLQLAQQDYGNSMGYNAAEVARTQVFMQPLMSAVQAIQQMAIAEASQPEQQGFGWEQLGMAVATEGLSLAFPGGGLYGGPSPTPPRSAVASSGPTPGGQFR